MPTHSPTHSPTQSPTKVKARSKKKGKMADPANPLSCLRWIKDEEMVHRKEGYGDNKRSVLDALEDQGHRTRVVNDFAKTVDKIKGDQKVDVKSSYDGLKLVSDKRLSCLEDMAQIAGLEDLLGALTSEFAEKASTLVAKECSKSVDLPEGAQQGIQSAAQNCILAVRANWAWISKLVKCTDVHLQHSSAYHEFYHEICEYQHWMPLQLRAAVSEVALRSPAHGNNDEAHALLLDLKELLCVFLHWQGKVDTLFRRSQTLHPVHLRTQKVPFFRPVSALCDYKTADIHVREGEELILMDNTETQSWKVRNMNAVESKVPAVILVIPGPDPAAVDAALKLRLELLMIWTENMKRIGKDLILFMILLLRDWTDDETKVLKAIKPDQKTELTQTLDSSLSKLQPHWTGFSGFTELSKRTTNTKKILAGKGNDADRDDQFSEALLERVKTSDELLGRYSDFWQHWDTYRLMLESSKHADHMLICDKLEQLKFISIDDLRKMWQAGLRFGADDNETFESWLERQRKTWKEEGGYGAGWGVSGSGSGSGYGQSGANANASGSSGSGSSGYGMNGFSQTQITQSTNQALHSASSGSEGIVCETVDGLGASQTNGQRANRTSVTTLDRQFESASTSQITSSELEEKKTFVITGVVDPKSGETVSMHQAVLLGIIDSSKGTYNDNAKGEAIPIPVAMSQGLIKVEFTTTKKSAERRHEVGLITLKTHKESRPYTVKSVVDAKTDEHLSVDAAISRGILDQTNGIYVNPTDNSQMSLADALDSGLLIVEFDSEAEVAEPEVVTKTYAIHGVVDQRRKAKVTFSEAVRNNLLDKETGAYYHNIDKEYIYVGDAIRRGFIKATVVKDPSSLDIDPENKMVVEKVQTIRKKLLNPMRALAAMKKAVSDSGK